MMKMIKRLLRTASIMILILALLSSCAAVSEIENQNTREDEYRQMLEEMGYSKREDVVAVTPILVLPKDLDDKYETIWWRDMHPFGEDVPLNFAYDYYDYEENEIYQKSSEMAIVIATKISSETYVKDKGIFIDDDQNVINDKRIVTVTKMRVDEVAETIKTSGNTLKVGDLFYVLEYRGEYSLKDEIYYENGLPYAIDVIQHEVESLAGNTNYWSVLPSAIGGSEYRAIADGQSICFLNLDDDPIILSGHTSEDVFNGWWDCTSISIEKRTYSINDARYDYAVIKMIEKYAWHLLDK